MDENTTIVLALQLVALFSIAGALLLYLLCKIRSGVGSEFLNGICPGTCKPVLVTSADSAIGLQVSVNFFTSFKLSAIGIQVSVNFFISFKLNTFITTVASCELHIQLLLRWISNTQF